MEFPLTRDLHMGFFSETLLMLYNYMIAKKSGKKFYIKSGTWAFGHTLGWNDYFTTFSDAPSESEPYEHIRIDNHNSDRQFTVKEYKTAMNDVFVFQPYLNTLADQALIRLGIGIDTPYTAIFIRRGDKLLGESVYIPAELYVQRALETNPSAVFVQTDDYRCFQEIAYRLKAVNANIHVVTTCPPTKLGHFARPIEGCNIVGTQHMLADGTRLVNNQNSKYLEITPRQKPFGEFTKPEIKEHTEEFLVGMILCKRGSQLILDNTGNVGKYLGFTYTGVVKYIEDLDYCIAPGIRLMPHVRYNDDDYITNPRGHVYHNSYK